MGEMRATSEAQAEFMQEVEQELLGKIEKEIDRRIAATRWMGGKSELADLKKWLGELR